MKKILLGVICILSLFLLTGCVKKTVITSEEFKTKVQEYNLTIQDSTEQYNTHKDIVKEVTLAINEESNWQIEFYTITNATEAKKMFQANYQKFEAYKENSMSSSTEVNMLNYNTYAQTTETKYSYISRVENTLLYVDVPISAQEDVKVIIETLGY